MTDTTIRAAVRRYAAAENADGDAKPAVSPRGELIVAQGLPPKAELARLGQTWTCALATGSAFTFVNAWPTTRAELVLFNGEQIDGKSYVIDSAFIANVTSQAAAQPYSLLAQLVPVATAPTDDPAQLVFGRSGKTAYGGRARRAAANTAAGQVANRWEALGSVMSPMTTNLGGSLLADLYGGWIVPPGGAFCLAGLAGTAAGAAIVGVTWHEVKLALGL